MKRGQTLLELLTSIVIIAVLIGGVLATVSYYGKYADRVNFKRGVSLLNDGLAKYKALASEADMVVLSSPPPGAQPNSTAQNGAVIASLRDGFVTSNNGITNSFISRATWNGQNSADYTKQVARLLSTGQGMDFWFLPEDRTATPTAITPTVTALYTRYHSGVSYVLQPAVSSLLDLTYAVDPAGVALPAFETLDSVTGKLTATMPTVNGITPGTIIRATNPAGSINVNLITMVVDGCPVFTSPLHTTGPTGTLFKYQCTGYNMENTPVWSASGLPEGLVIDSASGLISGIPLTSGLPTNVEILATSLIPVVDPVTNQVTGAYAPCPVKTTLEITITLGIPIITSIDPAIAWEGYLMEYHVTAYSQPTLYTIAETLPDGLTFNTTTGVLSGVPADGTAGVHPLTITATNATGTSEPKIVYLTIQTPPALTLHIVP